jgi:hypothetical protein
MNGGLGCFMLQAEGTFTSIKPILCCKEVLVCSLVLFFPVLRCISVACFIIIVNSVVSVCLSLSSVQWHSQP